ncbi:formate/nitrite transporter family protein [Haloquadratum walsbyi]|jgi:Formate/nitrite family of transporters|uniref:Formate/nitrite family of transporter n=1 Tax=Haloquadratum walsbyi J07HQW2 TaxID=1238425 RepID=U1NH67_9EURY|nr:formate/nitrite transporter family protein [Haloquadratum walsbyi]ERG96218.1 MAG: formate/nitrite family of transporter [Haloquadratum walsbyi J07HQW2]
MADSRPTARSQINNETDDGIPEQGEVVPERFSSDEVFQRIVADADHEVTSNARELFFSALAAGFAITITFLLYASMSATTETPLVAALLYPLGFIYIIIGGYQLYTENTLPPVALTLERLSSIPTLLRHWTVVLAGNFLGGGIGALALAYGGVFSPETTAVAVDIAQKGISTPPDQLFFKAAFAGFIVAGVVWLDFAAQETISRLFVVYVAFLAIPMGDLFHVVVSFTEAVFLIAHGHVGLVAGFAEFVAPVLIGNTIGGVLLVTVVNYYQTSERRLEIDQFTDVRRLSSREMLLGNLAGRSYVPVIDTLGNFARDPGSFRVLVPIANPRTETELVEIAARLASVHDNGRVHVVHVVQADKNLVLDHEHDRRDAITAQSEQLLDDIGSIVDKSDAAFESSTIVSPRSFEEIFDFAARTRPDMAVMGWGEEKLWNSARAERPIDELTNRLPCDFLIAKDRGLDCSNVLLPTVGGPDAALAAETARALQETGKSTLSLLTVVDSPEERSEGEQFLDEWAETHDISDAERIVDVTGDVEAAIEREAEDSTMVMLGATEQGILSRLLSDSLHLEVVNRVDASVVLAERPHDRSLTQRLIGSGQRNQ